jgi:magnesium transporter
MEIAIQKPQRTVVQPPRIQGILADSITRHMRTEFARLHINQTIGEALTAVRASPPANRVIYFYVVDDTGRVQGVVPTRRLLLNPLDRRIDEIMAKDIITLPKSATVVDACEFFILHRLLAFPVVDEDRRILGVVDVELYTSELVDLDSVERSHDLFQLIGVHLTEARQLSPAAAFRSRFPWLLANVTGGILAAFLAGIFQAELEKVVALALFIPVVLALSESVSIQSLSLALQLLHGRQPTLTAILAIILPEMTTGLFLGAASAAVVGLVAILWIGKVRLVVALSGGILGGVTCAAVIGMTMPNLLRLFRRQLHVAAGPIALACTDVVTLLIYFGLARWLLK